jgi:hypothetical protein
MSEDRMAGDLHRKAQITSSSFSYFPFWRILGKISDREYAILEPAAEIPVIEPRNLRSYVGEFNKYDQELDSMATMPSVPLKSALKRIWDMWARL